MGGKKLSDLTRLGTLPNTVNVLVEKNGEAKRISAGNLYNDVEKNVMDLLVKMSVAPVVLDENGALLADGDGAILLNV